MVDHDPEFLLPDQPVRQDRTVHFKSLPFHRNEKGTVHCEVSFPEDHGGTTDDFTDFSPRGPKSVLEFSRIEFRCKCGIGMCTMTTNEGADVASFSNHVNVLPSDWSLDEEICPEACVANYF